jgi:hypothetical protein
MSRAQRTKITFGDFGLPAGALQNAGETARSVVMGTIFGWADNFVQRKSPDGLQEYEGLSGEFRLVPSDTKREELESGVLFMPDAFHNLLANALRELGKSGDPNSKLQFALEVSAIRAKNPAGYSWEVQPLYDQGKNRLDEIASSLPKLRELAKANKRAPLMLEADKAALAKK